MTKSYPIIYGGIPVGSVDVILPEEAFENYKVVPVLNADPEVVTLTLLPKSVHGTYVIQP